jgi:hypothetical protein
MQVDENGIDLLGSDLMDKLNVMEVVPKIGTARYVLPLPLNLNLAVTAIAASSTRFT